MNCPKCGKQLPDGSVFCSGCGNKITNDTSSNNSPATPKKLITTTTNKVEGYQITEYLTTITGTAIYTVGGLFGGGLASQEKLFRSFYSAALKNIEAEANNIKADAIVGLTVNFTEAGGTGSVIIALVGTAVKLKKIEENS